MKVERIKIEKEDGVRIEIGECDVTVNIRENDTHEQSQYNDIIGETDKYIVSLIKNVDANGKLTWIAFFLTEKDDEQDEMGDCGHTGCQYTTFLYMCCIQ